MKRLIVALFFATVLGGSMLAIPGTASAQLYVGMPVGYAPPVLPSYPQPPCPGPNYVWVPGYWGWGSYGYYWVPGTWMLAPAVGLLWTPGYWNWDGGAYWWNPGYWASTVGYYGGIDYGYGYPGDGYDGGYWRNDEFYYNRAVDDVDGGYVRNTYYRRERKRPEHRVSYNGGRGGVRLRPTAAQRAFARRRHLVATAMQRDQARLAGENPEQSFAVNGGRPQIAATTRPGGFKSRGVVRIGAAGNAYVYRRARALAASRGNSTKAVQRYVVVARRPSPAYRNRYAAPVQVRRLRPEPPLLRPRSPRVQPPVPAFRNRNLGVHGVRMHPNPVRRNVIRIAVRPTRRFRGVRFARPSRPVPRFRARPAFGRPPGPRSRPGHPPH